MIMRDKAVRWCDGKIKIMIRIILECGIGRGDKRESVTDDVRKSRNWYR